MEINILDSATVPEGCILSVRAGAVRRQSVVSSGRPLKFPPSQESLNPLKIDVFKPIACGYLVMRPGEEQYKVLLSDVEGTNSPLTCELEVVRDSAGKGEVWPSFPQEENEIPDLKKREAAAKAKEYLDQHALTDFVQGVLSTVIKERPADPYKAMMRHFTNGYSAGEPRASRKSLMTPMPTRPGTANGPVVADTCRDTEGLPAASAEAHKATTVPKPIAETPDVSKTCHHTTGVVAQVPTQTSDAQAEQAARVVAEDRGSVTETQKDDAGVPREPEACTAPKSPQVAQEASLAEPPQEMSTPATAPKEVQSSDSRMFESHTVPLVAEAVPVPEVYENVDSGTPVDTVASTCNDSTVQVSLPVSAVETKVVPQESVSTETALQDSTVVEKGPQTVPTATTSMRDTCSVSDNNNQPTTEVGESKEALTSFQEAPDASEEASKALSVAKETEGHKSDTSVVVMPDAETLKVSSGEPKIEVISPPVTVAQQEDFGGAATENVAAESTQGAPNHDAFVAVDTEAPVMPKVEQPKDVTLNGDPATDAPQEKVSAAIVETAVAQEVQKSDVPDVDREGAAAADGSMADLQTSCAKATEAQKEEVCDKAGEHLEVATVEGVKEIETSSTPKADVKARKDEIPVAGELQPHGAVGASGSTEHEAVAAAPHTTIIPEVSQPCATDHVIEQPQP